MVVVVGSAVVESATVVFCIFVVSRATVVVDSVVVVSFSGFSVPFLISAAIVVVVTLGALVVVDSERNFPSIFIVAHLVVRDTPSACRIILSC